MRLTPIQSGQGDKETRRQGEFPPPLVSPSPCQSLSLTIDGLTVHARHGVTILTVAQESGIRIPHLCAYPGLSSFERCRLCVVEVEGMRGFPTACTTEVRDGMIVETQTEALQTLRKTSLELLLTEHPTGCLLCNYQTACIEHHGCSRRAGVITGCRFCPKDRTCELQQVVEEIGLHDMTLPVRYRGLPIERRDPFIERDDNLCILCARCVRVCDEVRGSGAISLIYRGSRTLVGTGYHKSLLDVGCQFCGACIDVCPTGSLLERMNKWEGVAERSVTTTCPHCNLGCAITLDIKDKRVIRSHPTEEGLIRGEICLKGRFAIAEFVNHPERLGHPLLRKGGRLIKVRWDEALDILAEKLLSVKGNRFSLFSSRNLTNEDLYIARKFTNTVMASQRIITDGRFPDNLPPGATAQLKDIEQASIILTICTQMRYSHTAAQAAVLQVLRRGGTHIGIEPFTNDLQKVSSHWITPRPGTEIYILLAVLRMMINEYAKESDDGDAVRGGGPDHPFPYFAIGGTLRNVLDPYDPEVCGEMAGISADAIIEVVRQLAQKRPAVLILGVSLVQSTHGADCVEALQHIASITGGKILPLLDTNNPRGTHVLGIRSDQLPSWSDNSLLLSLGQPPFSKRSDGDVLIVHDLFIPDVEADIVLPATAFTEEEGTVIDSSGLIRPVMRAVEPFGKSRPGWLVICEIAKRLGAEGFDFESPEAIRQEMIKMLSLEPLSSRSQWLPGPPEWFTVSKEDGTCPIPINQDNRPFTFRNNVVGRYVPGINFIISNSK